jgi:phosphotransferase family enzyme
VNLAETLSGHAGPEGLQELLRASELRSVLRRELKALLAVPDVLGPCRLRGVRFRLTPELKLAAYFDVGIRGERFCGCRSRAIAVTWKPRWIGYMSEPRPEVIRAEEEACRRGVATPFRRLRARVPAWGMRIQVSPLDDSFPQLVRMYDPGYVSRVIATACTSSHLTSGIAPVGHYTVKAIRYVPRQRHILRYDSLESTTRSTVMAKLYNQGQARRKCEVADCAAARLKARGKEITALQPLGYVPDDGVVFYPLLSGHSLPSLVSRCHRETGRALQLAGRAVRALHEAPPSSAHLLTPHGFETEMGEILHACGHIAVLLPSVGSAIGPLLDRARDLHERLPQEPPTFIHGDLKVEHLWMTADGLTLMDFDTSHLADPALDLGKLLADLRRWFDTYGQSGVEEAHARFLDAYKPGVACDRLARARLYEAVELVKIISYHIPLSERDWASRTERLIGSAQTVLNDLQRQYGSAGTQFSSKGFVAMFPSIEGVRDGVDQLSAKGEKV